MSGSFLLDTNVVIAVLAKDPALKNLLREKGRPIPENDIWIAATAKQHDLTLVSRDNHFDEVEGLSIERW